MSERAFAITRCARVMREPGLDQPLRNNDWPIVELILLVVQSSACVLQYEILFLDCLKSIPKGSAA